ncbi:hypothetical protein B0T17DRAFT_401841 [Bombardia bombarda]|uniref:Uncharacterized protein n=1 Tax=Bombardia bombarda TaxID=252184 RepID=A0AA39WCZ6_9PEZI|nr:hypothetical protein B0T17DRAFT_401841 [Bombardia bombarda]
MTRPPLLFASAYRIAFRLFGITSKPAAFCTWRQEFPPLANIPGSPPRIRLLTERRARPRPDSKIDLGHGHGRPRIWIKTTNFWTMDFFFLPHCDFDWTELELALHLRTRTSWALTWVYLVNLRRLPATLSKAIHQGCPGCVYMISSDGLLRPASILRVWQHSQVIIDKAFWSTVRPNIYISLAGLDLTQLDWPAIISCFLFFHMRAVHLQVTRRFILTTIVSPLLDAYTNSNKARLTGGPVVFTRYPKTYRGLHTPLDRKLLLRCLYLDIYGWTISFSWIA